MRADYRQLIHTLNRRYQEQFDRAEALAAELRHIRQSRLWRWCCLVRSLIRPGRRSAAVVQRAAFVSTRLSPAATADGRVSIIIPFRDRYELLRNCLTSLRHTTCPDYEIVLIDNGSRDKRLLRLLKRLQARRTRYKMIRSAEPFNFSRLCNLGARVASGRHLLFLNNDIEVVNHGWLEHMLSLAALPQVGVVGATLLYPDETIQHAGIFLQSDGSWSHRYRGCRADHAGDDGDLSQPRTVPAVTAACLLIRKDLFTEVGGFDEALPVIMNDVELCRRVRMLGLQVAISPDARLLHFESLSRGFAATSPVR